MYPPYISHNAALSVMRSALGWSQDKCIHVLQFNYHLAAPERPDVPSVQASVIGDIIRMNLADINNSEY